MEQSHSRQGAKKGRKSGPENFMSNQLKIEYFVAFVNSMRILTKNLNLFGVINIY